jgi:carboxypeptidase C (cathepsin A)
MRWFGNARRLSALAAALLVLAACGGSGGGGAEPAGPPTSTPLGPGENALDDPTAYSTAANASLPGATEAHAVTRHSIVLDGATLPYTARAGHLVARHPVSGAAQASFFHVSYLAEGADAATRPITFFYNGGPGSSSIWLHLGSFGPKRLATNAPSTSTQTPFPLVDNAESMLAISDLVFVDAIGTGHSQAIAPNTNQSFWGVDADAAVFRDFVVRWLDAHGRNASPTFLFGESYGTVRTAVLANLLESAGVTLQGVVLQSSVLNYGSNCGVTGDSGCGGYFPSYGETGAWHGRTVPLQADADAYANTLRSYTLATYEPVLVQWFSAQTPPDTVTASQMQALTGWPEASWRANPNLSPGTFRFNLMPNVLLGRYDARMTAAHGSSLAQDGDPSSTFISAQFAAAIGPYLRDTLRYRNNSAYVTLSGAIQTWDFSHDGAGLPDAVPDLAAAMAQNPQLKVLAVSGYHDLATPFHQTEKDLARLGANPNVIVRNYPGGHMTYLDDATRVKQLNDLRTFYREALQ